MRRLDSKVALVTGASRGIGRAIAKRFAHEGARVGVLARSKARIDQTVDEIAALGGSAMGLVCDITDPEAIKASTAKLADTYGTIDILVNNAAEISSIISTVLELDDAKLQRQFDGGPIAYLHFMQACYPYMEKKGGRIINFASSIGVKGMANFAPYAMAKEAIRALTRVAAHEWGSKGITVNNIVPVAATDGYQETMDSDEWDKENIPFRPPIARVGSPSEDIAPIALFLASDDSQFVTGYTFMGDGGGLIDSAR